VAQHVTGDAVTADLQQTVFLRQPILLMLVVFKLVVPSRRKACLMRSADCCTSEVLGACCRHCAVYANLL